MPPGLVSQIRIFPSRVTVVLKDGSTFDATDNPTIPSWKQSGWKIEPIDGIPWPILDGELTGVRGLFRFDEEMLHNQGIGYKLKPTLPAELFPVNPPPTGPGFFVDQITVVFKPGTTPSQVDAINALIGASVLIRPVLGTWYRIKLPPSKNLQDAFNFYRGRPEVAGLSPATNYGYATTAAPTEGIQANQTLANLPNAWVTTENAIGTVGSHQIRVAVIDSGVAFNDVDLARNIAINQGEIPGPVRSMLTDVDADGLISFDDLNDPANAAVVPADSNGNGIIDGQDLLASPMWANGVDQDDFDNDPATFIDDLVGWSFTGGGVGNNNPMPATSHGTEVAGVLGGRGDNGVGVAGAAWRVSIVPIYVDSGFGAVPDVAFLNAAAYVEQQQVDIANLSFGWHYASKNANNLVCTNTAVQFTTDIPQDEFDNGVAAWTDAFRVPPFVDSMGNVTSRVLYVFAAMNSTANVADPNVLLVPAKPMRAVLNPMSDAFGGNTLVVASNDSDSLASSFSNYGGLFPATDDPIVDMYAPGNSWTVLLPDGTTTTDSGTSFSAPTVSGVAALVLATHPSLRGQPANLRNHLRSNARFAPPAGVHAYNTCGGLQANGISVDADAAVSSP